MGSDHALYVDERLTSGAFDFDAALGLLAGAEREALLRAAAIATHCELPLTREHVDAISALTGESIPGSRSAV